MKYLNIAMLALLLPFASTYAAEKSHPCKQIQEACQAGGYTKGDHKKDKKGLFADCMKPIRAGQTVAGVTIDPSVVQACNAKKEKRASKRLNNVPAGVKTSS